MDSNKTVSDEFWRDGEPTGNSNCARLSVEENFKFKDIECETKYPYICKKGETKGRLFELSIF